MNVTGIHVILAANIVGYTEFTLKCLPDLVTQVIRYKQLAWLQQAAWQSSEFRMNFYG